jgi:hypothetical protein
MLGPLQNNISSLPEKFNVMGEYSDLSNRRKEKKKTHAYIKTQCLVQVGYIFRLSMGWFCDVSPDLS